MDMPKLKGMRELAGLTQFQVSAQSGVSRMRLSLAECGQVELNPDESAAVHRLLEEAIRKRASLMDELLSQTQSKAVVV